MQRKEEFSYLSDEELEALIQEVEAKELISAPALLKEKILFQAAVEESKKERKKKRSKQTRLFAYTAKVALATAAALIILFSVPDEVELAQKTLNTKPGVMREFTQKINQKSSNFISILNKYSFDSCKKEEQVNDKKEK